MHKPSRHLTANPRKSRPSRSPLSLVKLTCWKRIFQERALKAIHSGRTNESPDSFRTDRREEKSARAPVTPIRRNHRSPFIVQDSRDGTILESLVSRGYRTCLRSQQRSSEQQGVKRKSLRRQSVVAGQQDHVTLLPKSITQHKDGRVVMFLRVLS
uniref:Uncharacterized protein n=1 Tax=Steinernema glaseri TaxID=37863 RepID=A0A1I8A6C7_9BILA